MDILDINRGVWQTSQCLIAPLALGYINNCDMSMQEPRSLLICDLHTRVDGQHTHESGLKKNGPKSAYPQDSGLLCFEPSNKQPALMPVLQGRESIRALKDLRLVDTWHEFFK